MCIRYPEIESIMRVGRTFLFACAMLMPVACYQSSNVPATDESSLEDSATVGEFETESGDSGTPVDTETDSNKQPDSGSSGDIESIPLECQSKITFPDVGLETYIRKAIDKSSGEIFFSDISLISYLDFSFVPMGPEDGNIRGEIVELSGLECFINLQTLGLRNHQIVDISPLAALRNLEDLNLIANSVVEIEPLSHLTALKKLFLSNNRIVDISPLIELPHLVWLDLSDNQISDLEPLVSNTELAQGTTLGIVSNSYDCDDITTLHQLSTLENRNVVLYHDCE